MTKLFWQCLKGILNFILLASRNRGSELFPHLDSHLIKEVTSVANFVIGSLKLCLQFVHPFLTLLQLALKTQSTHTHYGLSYTSNRRGQICAVQQCVLFLYKTYENVFLHVQVSLWRFVDECLILWVYNLELLVLGVEVVSSLLELSDLTVQPRYHRLPVVPQLSVALLLHMQALPQRHDVHALQVQLVLLHTNTHRYTNMSTESAEPFQRSKWKDVWRQFAEGLCFNLIPGNKPAFMAYL